MTTSLPPTEVVYDDPSPQVRRAVNELPAFRLVEIPVSNGQDGRLDGDQGLLQRGAALAMAYHHGGPVAFGWCRRDIGGPLDVIVAGEALAAVNDASATAMLLPAGARAITLGTGGLHHLADSVPHWIRIGGFVDSMLVAEPGTFSAGRRTQPSLEDGLLQVWQHRFAWLVIAEPVTVAALRHEISLAVEEERNARTRSSVAYAVKAARWEHRHRELQAAVASGFWRLHILAGGETPTAARQVSAILCSSLNLSDLPYALAPAGPSGAFSELLTIETADDGGPQSPLMASTALLAAVAVPPAREVPGLRMVDRPDFDVTPETTDDAGLPLGHILDSNRQPAGRLTVAPAHLLRHTFVSGATGSGKSQTIRALLESATEQAIPWLVVEPAKAEYRVMANRIARWGKGVIVVRPGDVDLLPAGINPLEPAWLDTDGPTRRFPLQTHADMVRSLFLAAFQAEEPFPQVLSAALTRCYEQCGWDLVLGEPAVPGTSPRYPTLGDLALAAEEIVGQIGYSQEITRNVTGFIRVRVESLRHGTTGRFLEAGHRLDFARLLDSNVVFELEDVGDDRDKAFLMGTVLLRLVEHLRLRQQRRGGAAQALHHLAVFEEAHRLLRNTQHSGSAAYAVEMFASLLAEVRAYGQGIILADQIPSRLLPDAIKNTATKVVLRLPARDDRDMVGATMNLTESQSRYLVTMTPGEAAVFTDGMDHPVLVRMPDGTTVESVAVPPVLSAAQIVVPRSRTCTPACVNTPCTLRQIRQSQQLLNAQPWLSLWAELAVLAHLTGWSAPLPTTRLLSAIRATSARQRDCAIGHAVDTAISSRAAAVVTASESIDGIAAHVAEVLRTRIEGHQLCAQEEPRMLAAPYRWVLVWDALRETCRKDPQSAAHPRTSEWVATYGLPIPGASAQQQLAVVHRWLTADQSDPQLLRRLAFGRNQPSAIEHTVGAARTAAGWNEALRNALDQFVACQWPQRYLAAPAEPVDGRQ